MVVMTDQDEVSVSVGAEGNGGAFAFDPPAIRVDPGTTVVWEWNGKGGQPQRRPQGRAVQVGMVGTSGHTFSHTFEETGTYLYNCVPHMALGMVGAVVVE
ncbi:hypothetical protein C8039_02615 [Halogeometricum sp. wsp3]|nr:hypothetical protein C8039_02615 [Halogeometricum sp. wsp3]